MSIPAGIRIVTQSDTPASLSYGNPALATMHYGGSGAGFLVRANAPAGVCDGAFCDYLRRAKEHIHRDG
jgi:hypothetical protein